MRHLITTLLLTMGLLVSQAARADEAAAFDAVPEWPQAQVMCQGAAALPEMLRFAFQSEPEIDGRPEIIRVSSTRRPVRAAPVARQAGPPVLRLPCIRG